MRSLTQSSAGYPNLVSHSAPTHSLYPSLLSTPLTPQLPDSHTFIPQATLLALRHAQPTQIPHSGQPFFSLNTNARPRLLSAQARSCVSQAIQSSWATSTIKRYASSLRRYIRFCDAEQIPEHLRFPADEFVLCAFAASSVGKHARGTPRGHLSALKAWHIAHNLEWKGSPRLRYVLNGIHNLAPDSSKRPPRPPINAKMLSQLVESLDLNISLDAAVAACATTAFWGQCRLGELLPSSLSTLLSSPFPTRSGFKRSVRNPQSCSLHLPCTKTHQHG